MSSGLEPKSADVLLFCDNRAGSCIVWPVMRALWLGLVPIALSRPLWAAETYGSVEEREEERRPEGAEEPEEAPPEAPSAGGLVAPDGDLEGSDSRSDIEAELEHADQADSGRGLEYVWLSGDVGLTVMDLAPFSRGAIFPGHEESGAGVAYGGGIGARILYFTVGVRVHGMSLNAYSAWTVLGELGVRLPLGRLEPFGRVGLGYLGTGPVSANGAEASAGGFASRWSAGADYYFSDAFSLGLELSLDLASVSRGALDPALLDNGDQSPYAAGASALSISGSSLLNVGFHF